MNSCGSRTMEATISREEQMTPHLKERANVVVLRVAYGGLAGAARPATYHGCAPECAGGAAHTPKKAGVGHVAVSSQRFGATLNQPRFDAM